MAGTVWNDNKYNDGFNDNNDTNSDNRKSKTSMAVGVVKSLENGYGKIRLSIILDDKSEQNIVANPMDANSYTLPLLNESVFVFMLSLIHI